MRKRHELDARWPAVYGLVDRWAQLPPRCWRNLIDAQAITPDGPEVAAPRDLDQWIVRDLVETAWWMASTRHPTAEASWMPQARMALERAALRLVQPVARHAPASFLQRMTRRRVGHG